jgi:hypothetical protein
MSWKKKKTVAANLVACPLQTVLTWTVNVGDSTPGACEFCEILCFSHCEKLHNSRAKWLCSVKSLPHWCLKQQECLNSVGQIQRDWTPWWRILAADYDAAKRWAHSFDMDWAVGISQADSLSPSSGVQVWKSSYVIICHIIIAFHYMSLPDLVRLQIMAYDFLCHYLMQCQDTLCHCMLEVNIHKILHLFHVISYSLKQWHYLPLYDISIVISIIWHYVITQ